MNYSNILHNAYDSIKKLQNTVFKGDIKCMYIHGSSLYGTRAVDSDYDIIVIVSSDNDFSDNYQCIKEYTVDMYDFQMIPENIFIEMVKNHHIVAVEGLWMDDTMYWNKEYFDRHFASLFTLDKWKIRQTISSIVNNSWAKCHKKLTVQDDYDWYRGAKSLYHCIRLYIFGIQIATYGKIVDYTAANKYWNDIIFDHDDNHITWDYYKQMYQPVINSLRTEMVKLCPKPKNNN